MTLRRLAVLTFALVLPLAGAACSSSGGGSDTSASTTTPSASTGDSSTTSEAPDPPTTEAPPTTTETTEAPPTTAEPTGGRPSVAEISAAIGEELPGSLPDGVPDCIAQKIYDSAIPDDVIVAIVDGEEAQVDPDEEAEYTKILTDAGSTCATEAFSE